MKNNKLVLIFILGLALTSCRKPNDPESLNDNKTSGGYSVVNRFQTTAYAQDVIVKDNLVYVAQGEGGLQIIDISNPENPETISVTTDGVRGYSTKIAMKDSVVYLAAGTYGVSVLNVMNPAQPEVTAANLAIKPARNLHIYGKYLLAAISEQGVKVSDISYPIYPDIRGSAETNGYARGITTSADSNYLMAACGEMGFSIYNISDFEDGFGEYPLAGWGDTPGYAESVQLMDDKSIAFLACGTAGLQILDYSDTANIKIVGSIDEGGYAKELIYKDGKVIMTAEGAGVQIIDVSNVSSPSLIGEIETEYALGLDMDEDYIYVADEDEGLIIIKIP